MVKKNRQYTLLDRLIVNVDLGLKTILPGQVQAIRSNPADQYVEQTLPPQQRKHSAGLMRVNHAGEVAAQALYQGQALTARLGKVREQMQQAADEEVDHLAWCEQRLQELGSHSSYINVIWYLGSLLIGASAGLIGDKWSLGFVVETERQVVNHLNKHLRQLPAKDDKSRAIIEQMREDELQHATMASNAGAAPLPAPVKVMMSYVAKVMTSTAYYF